MTPRRFWCHTCRAWTDVSDSASDGSPPPPRLRLVLDHFWCSHCGDTYQCDECAFEIDRHGYCLRLPAAHK